MKIARALVHNPSILVMDEATSALATATERLINRNSRRWVCTCIAVAHRLSTVRDCNEIIVFDAGKVIERGTHEDLYQAESTYATLIRSKVVPEDYVSKIGRHCQFPVAWRDCLFVFVTSCKRLVPSLSLLQCQNST